MHVAIFAVHVNRQFWCPNSVKNRSAGARARGEHARPCDWPLRARAWQGHARAGQPLLHFHWPGRFCHSQRANGWLAAIHFVHAGIPESMHSGLPAPEFMQMDWIFCPSASQPATSLRLANMARTVKMGWLPGARMGVSAARAQGPGPRGYYSHVQRARAPADRYFTEFGHQKCQNAVKMGGRPIGCTSSYSKRSKSTHLDLARAVEGSALPGGRA